MQKLRNIWQIMLRLNDAWTYGETVASQNVKESIDIIKGKSISIP